MTDKNDTGRAADFVDNFSIAVDLMMENVPKDMCICFSVYARDPMDRTLEQPDGKMYMSSAKRCGFFDNVTFKEYVNNFYTN
jgi:hypothetical protein